MAQAVASKFLKELCGKLESVQGLDVHSEQELLALIEKSLPKHVPEGIRAEFKKQAKAAAKSLHAKLGKGIKSPKQAAKRPGKAAREEAHYFGLYMGTEANMLEMGKSCLLAPRARAGTFIDLMKETKKLDISEIVRRVGVFLVTITQAKDVVEVAKYFVECVRAAIGKSTEGRAKNVCRSILAVAQGMLLKLKALGGDDDDDGDDEALEELLGALGEVLAYAVGIAANAGDEGTAMAVGSSALQTLGNSGAHLFLRPLCTGVIGGAFRGDVATVGTNAGRACARASLQWVQQSIDDGELAEDTGDYVEVLAVLLLLRGFFKESNTENEKRDVSDLLLKFPTPSVKCLADLGSVEKRISGLDAKKARDMLLDKGNLTVGAADGLFEVLGKVRAASDDGEEERPLFFVDSQGSSKSRKAVKLNVDSADVGDKYDDEIQDMFAQVDKAIRAMDEQSSDSSDESSSDEEDVAIHKRRADGPSSAAKRRAT